MRILLLTACVTLANGTPAAPVALQTTASAIAVTIDAVVVDGSGRPVTGLAAGDFAVQLDGQSRRVVAVTYFPSGPPMAGAIGPSFDAVTAAPPAYRIVVQPPDDTSAGRDFAVAVAVNRTGARVQAPPHVAAAAVTVTGTPIAVVAGSPKSTEERLRAAISTGRTERGLTIQVGRAVRRGTDPAKLTLEVQLEITGSAAPPLTGLVGLVDPRGAMRSANPKIEAAGTGRYRVVLSIPLDPGAYKLRFAAADAAGTSGAIESSVNAQLTAMGPVLASDLLRWTMEGTSRRPHLIDEVPPDVTTIGATLELYSTAGAAPPHDVLVKMELAGIERMVAPEPRDGALVADAEFPLERLASGSYIIRATVTSAGSVLGTASATLVKR